jgi:hypothetical protein
MPWWPPGKISDGCLAPWLAALDEETIATHLPHSGGLAVHTDLHRDVVSRRRTRCSSRAMRAWASRGRPAR